MRIEASVQPRSYYRGAAAFLNGVDMTEYCIMVDDATGEIEVYRLKGGDYVFADDGDSLLTVTLKGNVEIIPPPDGWGAI